MVLVSMCAENSRCMYLRWSRIVTDSMPPVLGKPVPGFKDLGDDFLEMISSDEEIPETQIPETQRDDDETQLPETQKYVAPGAADGAAGGAAGGAAAQSNAEQPVVKQEPRSDSPVLGSVPSSAPQDVAVPAIPCVIFRKRSNGSLARPTNRAEWKYWTFCHGPTLSDDCPWSLREGGNVKAHYGSKKLGIVFCLSCYLNRGKIMKKKRTVCAEKLAVKIAERRAEKQKRAEKRARKAAKQTGLSESQRKWGHSKFGKTDKEKQKQKERLQESQLHREERKQKRDAAAAAAAAAAQAAAAAADGSPAAAADPGARTAAPAPPPQARGTRIVWNDSESQSDDDAPPPKPPPSSPEAYSSDSDEAVGLCTQTLRKKLRIEEIWAANSNSADKDPADDEAGPRKHAEGSSKRKRKHGASKRKAKHGEGSSKRTGNAEKRPYEDDEADEDESPKRPKQQYHNVGWGTGRKIQPGTPITAKVTETMLEQAEFDGSMVVKQGRITFNQRGFVIPRFPRRSHSTCKALKRRASCIALKRTGSPPSPQGEDSPDDGQ
jgi:hypothetical protein